MSVIKLECREHELSLTEETVLASGSVNADKVEFTFCPAWNGFKKKIAVFFLRQSIPYCWELAENNVATIPQEAADFDGEMKIGVFGVAGDTVYSSTFVTKKIEKGCITKGLSPSKQTPDLWAQVLLEFDKFKEDVSAAEEIRTASEISRAQTETKRELAEKTRGKAEAERSANEINRQAFIAEVKQRIDNGEFDGKDGYTPQKGKDYFDGKNYIITENDKQEITANVEKSVQKYIDNQLGVIENGSY